MIPVEAQKLDLETLKKYQGYNTLYTDGETLALQKDLTHIESSEFQ